MKRSAATSRDNPRFRLLKKLAHDNTAYRDAGQVWIEGEHLCQALVARGGRAALLVASDLAMPAALARWGARVDESLSLPAALMRELSALDSPAEVAMCVTLPATPQPLPGVATVVLDRVQDAGNVGSILRSAAAFGCTQVLALGGTAALWSPKVLRAGMGAHFALRLVEGLAPEALRRLTLPLLATSSHQGEWLHQARFDGPQAWLFGHEGQGLAPALLEHATRRIRIAQPGGEESLNVAAAAAICLHASQAAQASQTGPAAIIRG